MIALVRRQNRPRRGTQDVGRVFGGADADVDGRLHRSTFEGSSGR